MGDLIRIVTELDQHLHGMAQSWGGQIYLLIGFAMFTQTGLVLGPLLPGTTILFAAGMLAGGRDPILNLGVLLTVCMVGALVGNHANYVQGKWLGRKVFQRRETGLVSQESLKKTEAFMDRHGKAALVVSPFTPFVRSFAPFVAGMCALPGRRFAGYATVGVLAWVSCMVMAGAVLGAVPWVRQNIGMVFLAAFGLLTIKMAAEFWKSRRRPLAPVSESDV